MEKSAELINRSFQEVILSDSPEALNKWAAEADNYLRLVRREKGFARKIIPPMPITEQECIVSKNTDEMFYRAEKQPYSGPGISISWRGEPECEYLEGSRYDIQMNPIVSPLFEKRARELKTWKMPFTRIVEKQAALDMEFVEDELMIGLAVAAATAAGQVSTAPAATDFTPALLSEFLKIFAEKSEYTAETLLMSDVSYHNWNKNTNVTDTGGGMWDKVTVDGYTENKILGKKVIWSTKTHLIDVYNQATGALEKTRIFAFVSPDMLGNFLMLQDLKMYLEQKLGTVCFYLEEIIGIVIANVFGVAILEIPV